MSMFVHSRNDNIKMNKDFHRKIKSSIETTLLYFFTGRNLAKCYNSDIVFGNVRCRIDFLECRYDVKPAFFNIAPEKVRCRHDVKRFEKVLSYVLLFMKNYSNF